MIGYLAAQGSTGDSPTSYSFSSTTGGVAEAAGAAAAKERAIANVASMQMNGAKVCLLALLISPLLMHPHNLPCGFCFSLSRSPHI